MNTQAKRLDSLDILRGLIMFVLVFFSPLLRNIATASGAGWMDVIVRQCKHVPWEGLVCHDMIMPLFVFMSGCAIPYAFAKYRANGNGKGKIYFRIARRVVVLWILGMICQGNLCSFKPETFIYYSNTLQSIAVGYAVSAILFINTRPRTQVIVAGALLVAYWAGCTFISVDGYGGGSYALETNFPRWVDAKVLGEGGAYTWVFSSLNFIVTAMTGMFAGMILKSGRTSVRKMQLLLLYGVGMIAAGLLWSLEMPIIKHIWTSSMTLVTSGISFLLLDLAYLIADHLQWKGLNWLKVIGTNCILVYMLHYVHLTPITDKLLWGLNDIVGKDWYAVILVAADFLLLWIILRTMYKHKIFVKV